MGYDLSEKPLPVIDADTCIACAQCAKVCPAEILHVEDGRLRAEQRTFCGCIGCGQCMMVCPGGAITVRGRRFDPEDLVELPPPEDRAGADALDALMLARRSVRHFTDEEVDRGDVDRILDMIATAPMGIPPSEVGVLVLHGREKVRQFAEDTVAAFEKMVRSMSPLMLTLMRPFLGGATCRLLRQFVLPLMKLIAQRRDEGLDRLSYDAPLALLFHHTPDGDQADNHIASTYAMLAAQSLGLGSCWIGTVVGLDHDPAFKRKYNIPKENHVTGMLLVGHPQVRYRRTVRRKLGAVEFV